MWHSLHSRLCNGCRMFAVTLLSRDRTRALASKGAVPAIVRQSAAPCGMLCFPILKDVHREERPLKLAAVDYVILAVYFGFVIGIGWMCERRYRPVAISCFPAVDPVWITSLAFIAANLGAQELIGMAASGAKYGIMTAHFYWVGAIPAIVFMGIFMMPFSMQQGPSGPRIPEDALRRKDSRLQRAYFRVMTVFSSGISMYALGLLLHWCWVGTSTCAVLASAAIVLAYTYLGGLRSAIYNEVLQFFLIVAGFAPLAILACDRAGGWEGIKSRLPPTWCTPAVHGTCQREPMGVELFGMSPDSDSF